MEKKRKKRYGYLFLSMLILILVIPVAIQRMSAAVLDSAETMGSETAHVYALNEVAVTNQVRNCAGNAGISVETGKPNGQL